MLELKTKKAPKRERCILIAVIHQLQDEEKTFEYLEELRFLAETAGADTVHTFTQKLTKANPKTFLGTGKMEEITGYIKAEDIDMVVFDDELTPSQLKNIEALVGVKVMDRTNLILDIFAARAQVTIASLASGSLMNCSAATPIEGWTSVNIAMIPFLILASFSLIWLSKKNFN